MSKLNWTRAKKHRGFTLATEKAPEPPRGGWTHVKRQPVKTYTAEEIARWIAENPTNG